MKLALCVPALLLPLYAQVSVTRQGSEKISVTIAGQPFTDFYIGAETRKPYLHPLRSVSGKIVTRMYPMETNVRGETRDHPHHRGLWFTHGDVNGYDFWGNDASQDNGKKGRVVLAKINKTDGGKSSGLIDCTFNWNAPDGQTLLTESRKMIFYSSTAARVMDFDITLQAVAKVEFGDTKEGTFAIRLAPGLEEPTEKSPAEPPRTGKMVNAEGKSGEKEVWGKRSAWVDYAGTLENEKLGIAILDHPQNPNHPTYWHSRSYGLFAANIFGVHDFENDKTKNGAVTLEPGQSLRFRYRVIIHPGDSQSAGIAKLYQDYSSGK